MSRESELRYAPSDSQRITDEDVDKERFSYTTFFEDTNAVSRPQRDLPFIRLCQVYVCFPLAAA